MTDFLSWKSI